MKHNEGMSIRDRIDAVMWRYVKTSDLLATFVLAGSGDPVRFLSSLLPAEDMDALREKRDDWPEIVAEFAKLIAAEIDRRIPVPT